MELVQLSDDAAVQSIVNDMLASGTQVGKIFVDTTTVHPDTTKSISSKIQDAGALFVAGRPLSSLKMKIANPTSSTRLRRVSRRRSRPTPLHHRRPRHRNPSNPPISYRSHGPQRHLTRLRRLQSKPDEDIRKLHHRRHDGNDI